MPHAELHYSQDLALDGPAILAEIEQILQRHDAGSGAGKGRTYPIADFRHTHALVRVAMLQKPHRDAAFMNALLADLKSAVSARLPRPCAFSIELGFSGPHYHTGPLD